MNRFEREVLEMVEGSREAETGAWVNACLEYLKESGYITGYLGAKPQLTEKGKIALRWARQI